MSLRTDLEKALNQGFRFGYSSRKDGTLQKALTFKMVATNKETAKELAGSQLGGECVKVFDLRKELAAVTD